MGRRLEQCERGAKLSGVGVAEDGHRVAAAEILKRLDAGDVTGSEQRVIEIGPRFLDRRNGKTMRHRASSEAGKLREDEPHPVRALGAAAYFLERAGIDRVLGLDEAL